MQLTSAHKYLAISAAALTLFAACQPNRRGADYGFDYFQTKKKCEKEILFREKDEEYLKAWTAFRALLAQQAAQKPTAKVIVTGDSIAALFTPDRMNKYLPGVDVANTGIGGDTTVMLQQRVQDDIVARRPKAVLISIGGNDLLQGRCIPETLNNTRKIWESIRQGVPGVQIYQSSMPPTLMWKANAIARTTTGCSSTPPRTTATSPTWTSGAKSRRTSSRRFARATNNRCRTAASTSSTSAKKVIVRGVRW